MQYAGAWSGSSPILKKYKASAAQTTVGVIMLRSAADASGQMSVSTTTSAANAVGLLLDNGDASVATGSGAGITYSTTQGDPEAVYTLVVNPDSILRALMVYGAAGTSLTQDAVTTAAAGGLTITSTTAADFSSPSLDEGMSWYTSGANVGRSRKITSVAATVLTHIIPYAANAVGDTFLHIGSNLGLQFVTFTTDLANVRGDAVNTSGAAMGIWDLELNSSTTSYIQMTYADSVWTYTT